MKISDMEVKAFTTPASLGAHLANCDGKSFWLKLAKIGSKVRTITKTEAIEAALCHGWIDGQLGKFDGNFFLVRMTPRRAGSRWSSINRKTAERLTREGRMLPAGIKEIEKAKADGRWAAAYQPQSKAEVPPEFSKALSANADAMRAFAALDRANRYAFIYRVNDAKRPETRNRRIKDYVEMLARGETLHPVKKTHSSSLPPNSKTKRK
jgi:uncharacterized protein YdeI (YjbR/CyaY-like superfamily)